MIYNIKLLSYSFILYGFILFQSSHFINSLTVRSIQARAQSDEPIWNDEKQMYLSSIGNTIEEKYEAGLDSVNLGSIEGVLMYIQAEVVNQGLRSKDTKCTRKNDISYFVFYDLLINQPTNININNDVFEYGKQVAIDSGRCTPMEETEESITFPETCNIHNNQTIFPLIGAGLKFSDPRAPYDNSYWFSYLNGCYHKKWHKKTKECRKEYPGSLCPFGVEPDGIHCYVSYKILGYISIDELTGITNMKHTKTNELYKNFNEFCKDTDNKYNGLELNMPFENNHWNLKTFIPFWENPLDKNINKKRIQYLLKKYSSIVKENNNNNNNNGKGKMIDLPKDIKILQKENPKCYLNIKQCENGCKRDFYAQICIPCNIETDKDCIKK